VRLLAPDLVQQPPERLNREIAAAPTSWGSSPTAPRSPDGRRLAEQHHEWQVTRRYMRVELITVSLAIGQPDPTKEATPALTPTAA
jgi:hypothetical protein